MLDFVNFFVQQFFNFFSFLDSFIIVGNLTLLKLLFIIILFTFIIKILYKKGGE